MTPRRRTPRQERSKATRSAILEAAARVFSEVGLERATTLRIAEVAGVSPGSMYQYFPSKDSLVFALYEREGEAASRAVLGLVARFGTDDLPRLIQGLVEWMLEDIETRPGLNRVLFEEMPRLSGSAATWAIDVVMAGHVRTFLSLDAARAKPRDLDVASKLIVRSFKYSIIGAMVDGPLEGQARTTFVRELTDLLSCYILSPRSWETP